MFEKLYNRLFSVADKTGLTLIF